MELPSQERDPKELSADGAGGGTSQDMGQDEDLPCPAGSADITLVSGQRALSRGISMWFEAPSGKKWLEGAPDGEKSESGWVMKRAGSTH